MRGKGFTFKQFHINHSRCAMKVGTDGTLLGAWASLPDSTRNILDIGTGTGLIAIMAAQRHPDAQICAIDIDSDCILQAEENVAACPWSERIKLYHSPLQEFSSEEKFDVIISNPPYFPVGSGKQNFSAILEASIKAGAEYVIVEQDSTYDIPCLEAAKMSRDYLKSLGW